MKVATVNCFWHYESSASVEPVMPRQMMKLAQSPFLESFALKTWSLCSAIIRASGFNT